MRKARWVLVAVVLILAIGVGFALKRDPVRQTLPSLKPYITKVRTFYIDPNELYKSSIAVAATPAAKMPPMMMRMLKVTNLDFSKITELVHHDLTEKDQWHFEPWPPSGAPKLSKSGQVDLQIIVAYQGKAMAPGTALSMLGPGLGGPAHVITIVPDYPGLASIEKPVRPKAYLVVEQKELSSWEIAWLKIEHLGKSPYSSEKDLMDMGSDF